MDEIANCVNEYWRLKQRMAPGCEPELVGRLRAALHGSSLGFELEGRQPGKPEGSQAGERPNALPIAACSSLAGAGGGGFLYGLLTCPGAEQRTRLAEVVRNLPGARDMVIYDAQIDTAGILYSFS